MAKEVVFFDAEMAEESEKEQKAEDQENFYLDCGKRFVKFYYADQEKKGGEKSFVKMLEYILSDKEDDPEEDRTDKSMEKYLINAAIRKFVDESVGEFSISDVITALIGYMPESSQDDSYATLARILDDDNTYELKVFLNEKYHLNQKVYNSKIFN